MPEETGVHSLRSKNADGHQVAHPARRAFFARGDQLERPIGGDGLAVFAVGHQHGCVMHVGCDFTERVDHFVSV